MRAEPLAREAVLRRRDGEADDVKIGLRGTFGEAAPAAADLQHRAARGAEALQDAVVFAPLRRLQRVGPVIERGGIGHAGVQPQRIELVADVVMRLDVARRARDRIAPHQRVVDDEAEAVEQVAVGEPLQPVEVEQEQRHQILDAVGAPAGRDVFLAEADIAARQDAPEHIPVIDLEAGGGTRTRAPRHRDLAVGRDEFERAEFQAGQRLAPAGLDEGLRDQAHGHSAAMGRGDWR